MGKSIRKKVCIQIIEKGEAKVEDKMRGALVQRGKTWNVLLSTQGDNGQLKQKWISTGIKSQRYAEKILNEIMHKVNKNDPIALSKQTLGDCL